MTRSVARLPFARLTGQDILCTIPMLTPSELVRCVDAMIDHLDRLAGDADLEPEHDVGADDFGEEEAA